MATTLSQSTLHSSNDHLPTRTLVVVGLFAGGLAIGGIVTEGGHYVDERDCQPRFELCAPKVSFFLPDEPGKDPSGPRGGLRITTIATLSSTVTPTGALAQPTHR